jgi:hypothetical protein
VVESKIWHTHGAHVEPRRPGLWPPPPDAASPAAVPRASGGPPAGIRGPAVTLVPTPRLVLASAAFAQTDPCTRSSRTGTAAAFWLKMAAAHGSVLSQGIARGERAIVLLGRLAKPGSRRSVYTAVTEPDREGNCLRKARPRRNKPPARLGGTRPRRKLPEKGAAKETMKNTPAAPLCLPALFTRSKLALFYCSVPREASGRMNHTMSDDWMDIIPGNGGMANRPERK